VITQQLDDRSSVTLSAALGTNGDSELTVTASSVHIDNLNVANESVIVIRRNKEAASSFGRSSNNPGCDVWIEWLLH
jgi:hypothetical protein